MLASISMNSSAFLRNYVFYHHNVFAIDLYSCDSRMETELHCIAYTYKQSQRNVQIGMCTIFCCNFFYFKLTLCTLDSFYKKVFPLIKVKFYLLKPFKVHNLTKEDTNIPLF